ncbi:Alpha-L-arabinofuranosidase C [Pelomyxa schiedti]|nr:Alpha-L-arabinofuranosidase C [Pelomyxa schiedti]
MRLLWVLCLAASVVDCFTYSNGGLGPDTSVLTLDLSTLSSASSPPTPWSFGGQSTYTTLHAGSNVELDVSGDASAYYSSNNIGTHAKEAYLEMLVDLSSLDLPASSSANWWDQAAVCVNIAQISGPTWGILAMMSIFKDVDGSLKAMLRWADQALGFVEDTNIQTWVDGTLVHNKTVTHSEPYALYFSCGVLGESDGITSSSGSFKLYTCSVILPFVSDLFVSAASGNDANSGTSLDAQLKTITEALYRCVPGTAVHVSDGIYREFSLTPPSGQNAKDVTITASGSNVFLLGSIAASTLTWTQAGGSFASDVYVADTSNYFSTTPRFMVAVSGSSASGHHTVTQRYHIARDPNYKVDEIWRFTEYWEQANGGSSIPTCIPAVNGSSCDLATRSATQLIDPRFNTYSDPINSTIYVSDCNSGHYIYKRKIVSRNIATQSITVNKDCLFDGETPTLGLYSAWYVEDKLEYLDTNGEYFFDAVAKKLYFKISGSIDWSKIEISVSNSTKKGFILSGHSYIKIQGFNIMLFEDSGISENGGWNVGSGYSGYVTISNCNIQYCNFGLAVSHGCATDTNYMEHWTFTDCEVGNIDSQGISLYNPATFPRVGIKNFIVQRSNFHDMGFNCDGENRVGSAFSNPKYLYILDNNITRVSHNGFQISYSASSGSEITTGQVLVRGNTWNQPCCSNADCGCLKFWSPSESHVWRDILITENTCLNSFGWTYPSFNRKLWGGRGYGGFGWYTDHVGGVAWYRNIAYNNQDVGVTMYMLWEDSDNYIYNNLIIGSLTGYSLGGKRSSQSGDTFIKNNVFLDSEFYAFSESAQVGEVEPNFIFLDNNLYWHAGWNRTVWKPGVVVVQDSNGWVPYPTFNDLHVDFPAWETTALSFNPGYGPYDTTCNTSGDALYRVRQFDASAFEVTTALIDQGTSSLPSGLVTLLNLFSVCDPKYGTNYDLGPFEYDPTNKCSSQQSISTIVSYTESDSGGHKTSTSETSTSSCLLTLSPVLLLGLVVLSAL